jgi:hypothetical protein
MTGPRSFPLESIRTDGWFQRIGQSIGSFQALCEIIGARFFAFAMITGARITSLTVDRRRPENTVVEYLIGGEEAEANGADAQRLPLGEFRRRLVVALATADRPSPPPERATDTEALQLHIGVRYLLLAPLYGYALTELLVDGTTSRIRYSHDGIQDDADLEEFRGRLRAHVRDELRLRSPSSSEPRRGSCSTWIRDR